MGRLGFAFNMVRCVGCKTCQAACKDKNGLSSGHFFRRVIRLPVGDGKPLANSVDFVNYSAACCHCGNPACVNGCEAGAMRKNEDGTVSNDPASCIGCGACVWNCPYGGPKLSEVSGVSQKCDACADLLKEGRKPMCAAACPTFALDFGDLDELEKIYGPDVIRQPPTQTDSQTDPSILIKMNLTKTNSCQNKPDQERSLP